MIKMYILCFTTQNTFTLISLPYFLFYLRRYEPIVCNFSSLR